MTTFSVCVDASLVAKLVIIEPDSQFAGALWQAWISGGFEIYAPTLLPFEATSVVRKQVKRGIISKSAGENGLAELIRLMGVIKLIPPEEYIATAWKIATRYDLMVLYDACYVALAESRNTYLWTGDGRMLRAMPQHAGRIRTLTPQT